MEASSRSYKDEENQELAEEIRELAYEKQKAIAANNFSEARILEDIMDLDSQKLAEYLAKTYPDLFNVYNLKIKDFPRLKVNKSYSLSSAPPELVNFRDGIISQIDPKLDDLIVVSENDTTGNDTGETWTFFIDDNDTYAILGKYVFPDEFYDFLERMGLTGIMGHYIYKDLKRFESLAEKWPNITTK